MLNNKIEMTSAAGNARSLESGLTLIECLVAIVVVALTTATIAPMVVFAVATRVQNQKTEQAFQLAQSEIDKVRLVVEQGGDYGDRLDDLNLFRIPTAATEIGAVAAPTQFIASTANVTTATQARKLDIDGDGDDDFAIQLFRTTGIELRPETTGIVNSTPVVFDVGVRVYDARAERNVASSTPLVTDTAGLTFTSGEGDRATRPLAVLYSQIAQGDRNGSLCQYWEYTGSTPIDLVCN